MAEGGGGGGGSLGCRLLFNLGVSVVLLESLYPIAGCSPGLPPGYASYEVFVPRRLAIKNNRHGQLSYIIRAEGRHYIVHLSRKDVPLKVFPIFTYAGDKLKMGYHGVQEGCYYRGTVEGGAKSFVTLSACSGFRGLLQVENLTYGINPLKNSTSQHLIYRTEETDSGPCWLSGKDPPAWVAGVLEGETGGRQTRPRPQKGARFLELFVQVDAELYRHYSSDPFTAAQNVVRLVQMEDDVFSPLGLRVLLVGLGIWAERNQIFISDYVNDVVPAFNRWRLKEVVPRLRHDASLLLAYRRREPVLVTHSFFGSVCDASEGVAFVSAMDVPLQRLSMAVARELGHVLGVPDDPPGTCPCPPRCNCVAGSGGPGGVKPRFNCSAKSSFDVLLSGTGRCLDNLPEDRRPMLHYCGNGIVEGPEECDCGHNPQCKKSRCCRPDCRLSSGAVCAVEDCCQSCKVAPRGTLCRKSANQCDLPEYCSGASLACPPDVLVQDGTPCADGGYCYAGHCSTHTLQCQKIFGKESRGAPLSCFKVVNSKGDRFGNCDDKGRRFRNCRPEDVLCGRLQCVNVRTLPKLMNHMTILQTPTESALCWGLEFHAGLPLVDVGAVEEGAKCGQRKICINRFCVSVSDLAKPSKTCDPLVNCSGRGICNAKQHCHCGDGWAPPDCVLPGFGGSVDSGPTRRPHTSHRLNPAMSCGNPQDGEVVLQTVLLYLLYLLTFF